MDEADAHNEAATGVSTLLRWASSAALRDADILPTQVIRKALTVICDDIAAMVAASGEPEIQNVNALAVPKAPNGGSTLIAAPTHRVAREWAATANAVAANWLELDGGYRLATCHGSLYTLPSALAEIESSEGSVGDLITALVCSYEVVTRVARAYRPPLPLAAHPHATLSPLGAAAAIAAARRLDDKTFADTVLSAATFSMNGPFSHAQQGATIRNGGGGGGKPSWAFSQPIWSKPASPEAIPHFTTLLGRHTVIPKILPLLPMASVTASRLKTDTTSCSPVANTCTPVWRPPI